MTNSRFVTGLETASKKWVDSRVVRPLMIGGGTVALGTLSLAFGWDLTEASGLLAGAALLAGAMINTLLRVWAWADEVDRRVVAVSADPFSDVARTRLRERIDSLQRVQAISAWSVLASLGLVAALIAIEVKTSGLDPTQIPAPERLSAIGFATAATVSLGWLLVTLFISIVAETVNVGRDAVISQRSALGAKTGPSERV